MDEEVDSGKIEAVEIPFQENLHFKSFTIKHINTESKEDVKTVLAGLEKEAVLLNLIPIAFNDDLDREVHLNSLFVDMMDSINIIWDFILISLYSMGNQKECFHAIQQNSKDWISFLLNIQRCL